MPLFSKFLYIHIQVSCDRAVIGGILVTISNTSSLLLLLMTTIAGLELTSHQITCFLDVFWLALHYWLVWYFRVTPPHLQEHVPLQPEVTWLEQALQAILDHWNQALAHQVQCWIIKEHHLQLWILNLVHQRQTQNSRLFAKQGTKMKSFS